MFAGKPICACIMAQKPQPNIRRFSDHQGIATSPLYSLARLGLGRAYVLQNDTVKAKPAYQDFLANWKDADPDVPILRDAKAEYAKLQ